MGLCSSTEEGKMRQNKNPKKNPLSCIALIPAREGSKRIVNKNIRNLAGHPLIAFTIRSAIDSGIFSDVVVSTDSEKYAEIAQYYGATVPFLRPREFAGDLSPDIEWVTYTLKRLKNEGKEFDCFSILRPTSPFRLPGTIRRAWDTFIPEEGVDSLRAVEKCHEHPGKMWIVRGKRMMPLMPFLQEQQPWHSSPYQALPEIYVQNASLEIAWSHVVFEKGTIAGEVIMPFFTGNYEGFDINHSKDWMYAIDLIDKKMACLPEVPQYPYGTRRIKE
jgi:CMP-N,N'-diacetyllegionaminic acid synthase